MKEAQPGEYYYGFRCPRCDWYCPALYDPSRGTKKIKIESSVPYGAMIEATCGKCGMVVKNSAEHLTNFQIPPAIHERP